MHVELGGYHVRDLEFTAAFDVAAGKVGRDLAEAILAAAQQHYPLRRCTAARGRGPPRPDPGRAWPLPEGDGRGIGRRPATTSPARCARPGRTCWSATCRSARRRRRPWYAEQALEAGCAFVNCIPVFIASREPWRRRFEERRLPLIGDDIKSQVGATIVHRILANLFRERGVRLDRTYQLNFGGNTDFLQHAGARPARIEEDLEDPGGHEPTRPRPAGRGRACRPERLRAVADRPQVLLHPAGRDGVRQRAAQLRAQARGLGFAELGRRRHRRGALRQAGARPRHRRRALRAVELLHEVAARASTPTPRRGGGQKPSSAASPELPVRRRLQRRTAR